MKAIIKALGGGLKAFFGGHSWVGFGALGVVILGLWWDYSATKSKNEELKLSVENLETEVKQKDETIASQARTAARREQAGKQSQELQKAITDAPQTNECGNSESIRIVLDSLYERTGAKAANTPE